MSRLLRVSCSPVRWPLAATPVPWLEAVLVVSAASAARTTRAVRPLLPPPMSPFPRAYMLAAAPTVPLDAPGRPLPTCVMTRKCPLGGESARRRSPSALVVVIGRLGGGTGAIMDRCCNKASRSSAVPPVLVLAPERWWHCAAAAPMVLQKLRPVVALRSRSTYGLAVAAARL